MNALTKLTRIILLLLAMSSAIVAQQGFYLKNNDRVVFYGDSITEQRLYTTFVETYALTRFPSLKIDFTHSGWGGDRVTGGGGGPIDARLQRDVLAYQPTVITIMLGMNDASYQAYNPDIFNTYASGYRRIVQTLKSQLPDARLTVIQPSPFDDVTRPPGFEGGYNGVLVRYGEFVRDLAQKENLHVADLNTSVVAGLHKAKAVDEALAQKIIPDRVHPGPSGHLLMAEALLKAWNAPAVVTTVEIDAGGQRVLRADNTRVTDLSNKSGISWMQLDNALPMPFDTGNDTLMLVVRASNLYDSLNQQMLKVTSLNAPRYRLSIDGQPAGMFTREQLEKGINLAELSTPMQKQATTVHSLTLKRNDIHSTWWRQLQVPFQKNPSPYVRKAMESLRDLEQDLIKQQRAAAQPRPHRYQLESQNP